MRKAFLIFVAIISFSCMERENSMLGLWKVDSKFYKATCEIVEEANTLKGLVIYYNDDTTVYRYKEGEPKNYFFNNLKEKNGVYVDAVAGATKMENLHDTVTLNQLSKDTLEVTTHMMHKPIKEIWIRH
ncbi:hypothetical protein [uncultured Aquimarina sp.]|uniref:hypothetical protein n=1 Tax=uncultured Aquimarina sp. TaxID=575652 RepID=UPI002629AFE7|nr:hypothetical protein [uncultured Aquimarina sp.]